MAVQIFEGIQVGNTVLFPSFGGVPASTFAALVSLAMLVYVLMLFRKHSRGGANRAPPSREGDVDACTHVASSGQGLFMDKSEEVRPIQGLV